MSLGGGGSSTGAYAAQLESDREERARQDRLAEQARQDKIAADAADQDRFNNELSGAYTSSLNRARQRISSKGLNPSDFENTLTSEFDAQKALVPNRSTNVGSYFGTDLVDNILNTEQSNRRSNYRNQVNSTFNNGNFDSLFSTTADDPYVTKTLDSQRSDAIASLDRAKARGNLNDVGYNKGLDRIGELYSAGNTTANALTDAITQRYKGQYNDAFTNALTNAGNYELGGSFDVNPYLERANTVRDSYLRNLEGEVGSALNGQSFFDIGDILTKAGVAQGAVNPAVSGTNLAALLGTSTRNTDALARGLGGSSF